MSEKYGWGWLWKSWASPIGFFCRLFGLLVGWVPKEDRKPEVAEGEYRFSIMPVAGYGMKELVETGKRLFSKYGETKESIAETLSAWQEAMMNDEWIDIADHFTMTVTKEQRDQLIADLGKSKCWRICHDEYADIEEEADHLLKRLLRNKTRDEIVKDLAESLEKTPMTKDTISEMLEGQMEGGRPLWMARHNVEVAVTGKGMTL